MSVREKTWEYYRDCALHPLSYALAGHVIFEQLDLERDNGHSPSRFMREMNLVPLMIGSQRCIKPGDMLRIVKAAGSERSDRRWAYKVLKGIGYHSELSKDEVQRMQSDFAKEARAQKVDDASYKKTVKQDDLEFWEEMIRRTEDELAEATDPKLREELEEEFETFSKELAEKKALFHKQQAENDSDEEEGEEEEQPETVSAGGSGVELTDKRHRDRAPNGLYYRPAALLSRGKRGKDAAQSEELDVAFSSDTNTVKRFDWELGEVPEILVHEADSAILSPLLDSGSVLRNHDPNQPVGKPLSARIDPRLKRGFARMKWGTTPCAKNARQEVADETLRGVSFGYEPLTVQKIKPGAKARVGDREYSGPALLITKWSVYELTLTTIPADPSVGVGKT